MASFIQDISAEISDNWPAFLYIAVMAGFSIRFLSERRAETRVLKRLGAELHETIQVRFDRLEEMIRNPSAAESGAESHRRSVDKFVGVVRRL
jgi:hypothetical protein